MSEILKPCPFCGSDDVRIAVTMHESWYYGECESCASRTGYLLSQAEAIDAWNTRAERTCTNTKMDGSYFMCSRCHAAFDMLDWEGEPVIWVDDSPQFNSYCPHCGAKVVSE